MKPVKLIKINCIVDRELSAKLAAGLKNAGILKYFIQPSRCSVLKEKTIVFDYRASTLLENKRTDFFRFYIPHKYENAVLAHITDMLKLNQPGRGSIFSEEVSLLGLSDNYCSEELLKNLKPPKMQILSDITGICCIVQRGEGIKLSRAVLERGISVPVVTYGTGMGLRNKLGLLRITIAREKDIIFLTAHKHDAADAMNLMIETAGLDYPGKGFIYTVPLRKGILDTKIFKGESRHVASMEQMITAIDEIKKSTDWRRKSASFMRRKKNDKWNFFNRQINYTLICNEGESGPFIKTAMDNGAGGATLSKLKYVTYDTVKPAPAGRERSDLIINNDTAEKLLEIYGKSDFFSSRISGLIELSGVDKASVYI